MATRGELPPVRREGVGSKVDIKGGGRGGVIGVDGETTIIFGI